MLNPIQRTRRTFVFLILGVASTPAVAVNVAHIHSESNDPQVYNQACSFYEQNGHTCTAFPTSGPTSSLDTFDVVVDTSFTWADPDGLLADHMRKGRSVITMVGAPHALGIDTNPTVQAWIGANKFVVLGQFLITSDTDAILGNTPIGTVVGFCGFSPCGGLLDTTGHPNAKVLVNFAVQKTTLDDEIGMLRNRWEGGQSVYISDGVEDFNLILRAVEILGNPVPAVSTWGLVVMTLIFITFGTLLIRSRQVENPSC